jgi:hypothetical protein
MRTSAQGFVGRFKGGDSLFALDGRKRVKEFLDTVAPFQIVDEIPEGNTRSDKYGDAAKDVRIAVNDGGDAGHVEPPAVILLPARTRMTPDRPGGSSAIHRADRSRASARQCWLREGALLEQLQNRRRQ